MIIKKVWSESPIELVDRLKRIDASAILDANSFVFKVSEALKISIS